jgi:hypothetical protein
VVAGLHQEAQAKQVVQAVAVVGVDLLDIVIHGLVVLELLDKEILAVKDSTEQAVAVAVEKVLLDKIEMLVAQEEQDLTFIPLGQPQHLLALADFMQVAVAVLVMVLAQAEEVLQT